MNFRLPNSPSQFRRWLLLALAGLTTLASDCLAHEKWFAEGELPALALGKATEILPLSLILGVIIVSSLAWLWFVRRGRRDLLPDPQGFGATPAGLTQFYALVPLILGIHFAVALLSCGLQGVLFSPNNQLTGGAKYWFGVAQTGVALAFFYGAFTRVAAGVLALLWVAGIFLLGLEPMLENALYLGIAAFFFLVGRGPWAIDRLLIPNLEPPRAWQQRGLLVARVALGVSLIVVAFTEKLANPDLALKFLQVHPLNFTRHFGIPMSDELFIACAGAVELLVGLWIMFGIFPRVIILIAWLPFNLTLTYFSWQELIGHLPFYGLLAVFLVWDPVRHEAYMLAGFRGESLSK
jgi:uncharacterized membrane protein YphA (DoxX/SURF4 family)